MRTLKNGAIALDERNGYCIAKWNDEYVTWAVDKEGNAYWGHYFSDIMEAVRDYMQRAEVEMD
jgi:hypothetical protein